MCEWVIRSEYRILLPSSRGSRPNRVRVSRTAGKELVRHREPGAGWIVASETVDATPRGS